MLLISHRGNTSGRNPDLENTKGYIQSALDKGYIVECDMINGAYWGHDIRNETICDSFIERNKENLLIHCKDFSSIIKCETNDWHFFFHYSEEFVMSSRGWVIAHSKLGAQPKCICMLPEIHGLSKDSLKNCAGICSDIIEFYD